jgi:hypothetical protein
MQERASPARFLFLSRRVGKATPSANGADTDSRRDRHAAIGKTEPVGEGDLAHVAFGSEPEMLIASTSSPVHPHASHIGEIERGFDFLDYHFSPAGLTGAVKTIRNFIEKHLGFMSKSAARVLPARHLKCTSGGCLMANT